MSSPVLARTTSSPEPTTSSIPRASLAPPVPPASTTTGPLTPRSQPGDLDSSSYPMARVDRNDQRRQLLGDPCHLEPATIDRAQALDPLDQLGHLGLVGGSIAAEQDILVQLVLEVG